MRAAPGVGRLWSANRYEIAKWLQHFGQIVLLAWPRTKPGGRERPCQLPK